MCQALSRLMPLQVMEEQTMLGAFIRLVDNLFCEKLIERVVTSTEELLQLLSTNTQMPGGAGKWQQAGPGRWTLAGSGTQVGDAMTQHG